MAVLAGNLYDKYGTRNPIARRLVTRFLAAVDALTAGAAPRAVLEVGAGEGELTRRLRARWPAARVVAIDASAAILHRVRRRAPGAYVAACDARRLPFCDGAFDLVLLVEVLEHVADAEAALDEAARVTSGAALLCVPREPLWRALNVARGAYVGRAGNTPGHVRHWSRAAFVRFVARRFRVAEVRSPIPWTVVRAER